MRGYTHERRRLNETRSLLQHLTRLVPAMPGYVRKVCLFLISKASRSYVVDIERALIVRQTGCTESEVIAALTALRNVGVIVEDRDGTYLSPMAIARLAGVPIDADRASGEPAPS